MNYLINQDYEFEILDSNLGYFQKRSIIRQKKEESLDKLVLVEDNKILSVETQEDLKIWLPYEKGKFYYTIFQIPKFQKYVLINESDEFFYGFIDGFPCVFKDTLEECQAILQEYADDAEIFQYAVGHVTGRYLKNLSLKDIKNFVKKEYVCENIFVMEENVVYGEEEENIILTELFLDWYGKKQYENKKKKKHSVFFFVVAVGFLISAFILKYL